MEFGTGFPPHAKKKKSGADGAREVGERGMERADFCVLLPLSCYWEVAGLRWR